MFGISGSVLCSAGPGLPRPSIIIYLFFPLAIGSRCFSFLRFRGLLWLIVLIPVFAVTGDCLPVSTVGCGNPACITEIYSSVLVYVVHAVGCRRSAVVGSL